MAKRDKRVKFGETPKPRKTVRIAESAIEDGHPLAWRFSDTDTGGPFAWLPTNSELFPDVFAKLVEFESKNWNEITRGGSHPIPVPSLGKSAKERLVEIKRDDLDELLSLRLTGSQRVWCAKLGHIVRPLWWDPDHQVYPVEKDKNDRRKRRKRKGK